MERSLAGYLKIGRECITRSTPRQRPPPAFDECRSVATPTQHEKNSGQLLSKIIGPFEGMEPGKD